MSQEDYERGVRYGKAQTTAAVTKIANNMADFAAGAWDAGVDEVVNTFPIVATPEQVAAIKERNPHRRKMPDTIEGMFGND